MSGIITSPDFNCLIGDIKQGILGFQKSFPLNEFENANYKQQPIITMLCCSDARVPSSFAGSTFNRMFCVENIGNQVKTAQGSVLYGLLHLNTPVMLISGHSDCGAIKAAYSDFSAEPEPLISELLNVKDSLDEGIKASSLTLDLDPQIKNIQLAEVNVDIQIKHLLANQEVAKRVANNQLIIMGIILDLHNIYQQGHGLSYICNLNGENKTDILMQSSILKAVNNRILRLS